MKATKTLLKRSVCAVLALCMAMPFLPITASATEVQQDYSSYYTVSHEPDANGAYYGDIIMAINTNFYHFNRYDNDEDLEQSVGALPTPSASSATTQQPVIYAYDSNGKGLVDPRSVMPVSDAKPPKTQATQPSASISSQPSQSYTVGQTKDFAVDVTSDGLQMTDIAFELVVAGESCTVWTPAGLLYKPISDRDAQKVADEFDRTYDEVVQGFGDPLGHRYSDPDGDGKVAILAYDIDNDEFGYNSWYTGGYFFMADILSEDELWDANGNNSDMIHIDTAQGMVGGVENIYATLVHEFQHLVNFVRSYDSVHYMPDYLNEAFSEAAVHLSYHEKGINDFFTSRFLGNYQETSIYNGKLSLTSWDDRSYGYNVPNYAYAYLFGQYIRTRYEHGERIYGDFFDALEQRSNDLDVYLSETEISELVAELVGADSFDRLVKDFYVALFTTAPTGVYGFGGESWAYGISTTSPDYTEDTYLLSPGSVVYLNSSSQTSFVPSGYGEEIDFISISYADPVLLPVGLTFDPIVVTVGDPYTPEVIIDVGDFTSNLSVVYSYFDSQGNRINKPSEIGQYEVVATVEADSGEMAVVSTSLSIVAKAPEGGEEEYAGIGRFTDIVPAEWSPRYLAAFEFVDKNELMGGVSADKFSPLGTVSRAMIVTVLHRYSQLPEAGENIIAFSDVLNNDWYTGAVAWASSFGIVNGTSATTFSPNDSITKEQIATILYRSAGSPDVSEYPPITFADAEAISDWAYDAIVWANAHSMVFGDGLDMLYPTLPITRAEVAYVFMQYNTAIGGIYEIPVIEYPED